MKGFVRSAFAVALVALSFGVQRAAASELHPSLIAGLAFQFGAQPVAQSSSFEAATPANLVSDSVFGIDVQLPVMLRAPQTPLLTARFDPASLDTPFGALPAPSADVTFQLRDAQILARYQGNAAPAPLDDVAASAVVPVPIASYRPAAPFYTSSFAPNFDAARLSVPVTPLGGGSTNLSNDNFALVVAPVTTFATSVVPAPPAQVGPNAFAMVERCGTADFNDACPSYSKLHAPSDALLATTGFNVRAGGKHVGVGISASSGRLSFADSDLTQYEAVDPNLPSALTYSPAAIDLTKRALGASVNVPISPVLSLALGYNTQHFQGLTAASLDASVDARKDAYLGNLTYQLPHTNSALSFSARQYRYQDAFVPSLNVTTTREDVNFTVKF